MLSPKIAKIQQTQFVVLESSIKINLPDENSPVDLSLIPIELEFDILHDPDSEPDMIRIIMSINGNRLSQVPGYEIFLRVGGEYKLAEDLLPSSEAAQNLVQGSAVACMINEIRVYIQTMTCFYPFGPYIMPMFDMKDIWDQKRGLDPNLETSKSQEKPRSRRRKTSS